MGCFSWKFCDTKERKRDERRLIINRRGYLLIPQEFGGGHIEDEAYNGYGNFNGKDVYDLVADWNREYMASHPDFILPYSGVKVSDKPWYSVYADLSNSRKDICRKMRETKHFFDGYRWIGIELACYDEDNAALPYPIKIAKYADSVYEKCKASKGDPMQGCF